MAKKMFAFVVAVAVVLCMMLPVAAETPSALEGNVVSHVDYRTESPLDTTGNLVAVVDKDLEMTYTEFEGVTCIDRSCDGAPQNEGWRMQYIDGNYQSFNEVYTLETYVYLTEELYGSPIQIWWGGDDDFAALNWTGYEFGFGPMTNHEMDPERTTIESEERDLTDGWYHVVVTSDKTTTNLYVNGELVGTSPAYTGGMAGLWYYYNCKSNVPGYGMAYITFYNVAATAEQVALMYNPNSGSDTTPTSDAGDATPTPDTGDATPTPDAGDATPSPDAGGTTPAPTKTPSQPNTETFDMGIVSFAAVALSSLVAVKKRK